MPGPLEGVRVIDLTTMVSGPVATRTLADQGADVIKVESPAGDQVRYIGPTRNGVTAAFFSCNRGKRSICLDLKSDGGKETLRALLGTADIVVQNFRPGAMARMGFDETAVRALKPDIIYVSISGFGETGPYAHKRVYDPVVQALSGATDIQADRKTGEPRMFRVILADKVTALTAAQAMTAALFARTRTGAGQHIKLSMLDAVVSFFWPECMAGLTFVGDEIDSNLYQGTMDLIYKTRDGYITAGAVSDKEWRGLCQALNKPEWIDDERFKTADLRFRNVEERKQLTAVEMAKWQRADILARLDEEDVPAAPLLTRADLLDDEQMKANALIEVNEYGALGLVRQPRPAALFDVTPGSIAGAAPRLGQHTREVLAELDLTAAKQNALLAAGAIAEK